MKCQYCDSLATRVAYYGDEDTCLGGGQATLYVCAEHTTPCNHPSDPHAGFDREEVLPALRSGGRKNMDDNMNCAHWNNNTFEVGDQCPDCGRWLGADGYWYIDPSYAQEVDDEPFPAGAFPPAPCDGADGSTPVLPLRRAAGGYDTMRQQCSKCGAFHAGKCLEEDVIAEREERSVEPLCAAPGCRNVVFEAGEFCEFCEEEDSPFIRSISLLRVVDEFIAKRREE